MILGVEWLSLWKEMAVAWYLREATKESQENEHQDSSREKDLDLSRTEYLLNTRLEGYVRPAS
jgi:hypothetical protein